VLTALAAAKGAGVPRFVLASVPGASPEATDPFLRAKGLAEEAVATSGLEYAVLRCSHVYGLGGLWFTAAVNAALADPPLALGTEPVAPVLAEDVASVLDAIEDRPDPLAGTWALEGPDAVRPQDLVRLLVGDRTLEVLPPGQARPRLEELLGVELSPEAADHLLRAERADAPDAAEAFGVERTPLERGLAQVLESAAAGPASAGAPFPAPEVASPP
jgi:uncharacterized protein YbjT (DUF2867 family)